MGRDDVTTNETRLYGHLDTVRGYARMAADRAQQNADAREIDGIIDALSTALQSARQARWYAERIETDDEQARAALS
jgi:hypothetical protein